MSKEICPGCDHPLRLHFKNIEEDILCLHTEHGRSTGVIMDYYMECDCTNHISKRKQQKKAEEKREAEEQQKAFEERFAQFKVRKGL